MRPLLVSGFEAFGGGARNATRDALRVLSADPELMAIASFVVLPVTWRGAASVLRARRLREGARAVLAFGMAGPPHEMRVERYAYNEMRAPMADNAGIRCDGDAIDAHGVARIETRGDHADRVRAALDSKGVPATDSHDPGRFVCNATYFAMLTAAALEGFDTLFVHVPATATSGGSLADATVRVWMRDTVVAYAALFAS